MLVKLRRHVPLVIEIAGAAAVCVGVLLYSIPAGLIVTGLAAILAAQGIGRRARHDATPTGN